MAVLSIASGTASGVFRRDGLHDARALRPRIFFTLATDRLLRRFATRRSRRIGLRISGEIENNAPADENGRSFAAASV
jgi:hypothetical protein